MKKQLRVPTLPGKSAASLDRWFQELYAKGLLFNPDDRPEDIVVIGTGEFAFSKQECLVLNASVHRLFEWHGDKVREVALKYFHKAMGITPQYSGA